MEDINVFVSIKEVPLIVASPGVCIDEYGNAIFKTEYQEEDKSTGEYYPICYNCAGERWHGNFNNFVRSIIIS